jgi:hypothetical protein
MSVRNNNNLPERNRSAGVDSREAQRVPFYSPVTYTSEEAARRSHNKGQLLDLSKKGCRILGPVLGIGCTTTIMLDLNDGKASMTIVDAIVCWNDGYRLV